MMSLAKRVPFGTLSALLNAAMEARMFARHSSVSVRRPDHGRRPGTRCPRWKNGLGPHVVAWSAGVLLAVGPGPAALRAQTVPAPVTFTRTTAIPGPTNCDGGGWSATSQNTGSQSCTVGVDRSPSGLPSAFASLQARATLPSTSVLPPSGVFTGEVGIFGALTPVYRENFRRFNDQLLAPPVPIRAEAQASFTDYLTWTAPLGVSITTATLVFDVTGSVLLGSPTGIPSDGLLGSVDFVTTVEARSGAFVDDPDPTRVGDEVFMSANGFAHGLFTRSTRTLSNAVSSPDVSSVVNNYSGSSFGAAVGGQSPLCAGTCVTVTLGSQFFSNPLNPFIQLTFGMLGVIAANDLSYYLGATTPGPLQLDYFNTMRLTGFEAAGVDELGNPLTDGFGFAFAS